MRARTLELFFRVRCYVLGFMGFMAYGVCIMFCGLWCTVDGVWLMVYGLWYRVEGLGF